MRKTILLVVSCCCSLWVSAQTKAITGTITAQEDGQPMIGVNVVIQGTNKGTVTDIDGKYEVSVETGEDNLVFSYIGYVSQTVSIGDRTVVDVVMKQDVTTLADIVVV